MADSEPAVYSARASSGRLASAAQIVRPNTKLIALLTPLLAVAATRLLPAPRVQEAR